MIFNIEINFGKIITMKNHKFVKIYNNVYEISIKCIHVRMLKRVQKNKHFNYEILEDANEREETYTIHLSDTLL